MAGRGRPKGAKSRPHYIIEEEKKEKARLRAIRIANGEVIKRGRKPGTPNRAKDVIEAERIAREQLKKEKILAKEMETSTRSEPIPVPVGSVFVLNSEVRARGILKATRHMVTNSSPWLIDWQDSNNNIHCVMPCNITIVVD